ncbi:MAG: M48 family metalloprotease [Deltaproteobacteria bacterium]|nr:M48 family metalloprotease [Deltaproteobacteria bacterium]
MRVIQKTALGLLLAASVTQFAFAADAAKASASTMSEFKAIDFAIDATSDPAAASAAEIDNAFNKFRAENTDIAGLFGPEDFRTPALKKYLEKVDFSKPETISKLGAYRKKLDAMQIKMRNVLSLGAVQVGPKQLPRIYKLAAEAAQALELSQNFHLFVMGSSEFNAYTYSYDVNNYDIVIYSALVDALTDEGLKAVIGHEMGHVKDRNMLNSLILAADFESKNAASASDTHAAMYDKLFGELPVSMRKHVMAYAQDLAANKQTIASFDDDKQANDFQRNAELTADRAGEIATGSAQGILQAMSTLAYGSKALTAEFNMNELIAQIRNVLANTDSPDDVDYLVQRQGDHPFHVLRLVEASDFEASKAFKSVRARLTQNSFGKELDLFARIASQAADASAKFKKYLEDKADTDDTLVRLKTKDQYTTQLGRLAKGFSELGLIVIGQLDASALNAPGDAIFDQFVSKIKEDKADILKQLLAPPVVSLLKKRLETAKDAEAVELKAKLKQITDLQEVQ